MQRNAAREDLNDIAVQLDRLMVRGTSESSILVQGLVAVLKNALITLMMQPFAVSLLRFMDTTVAATINLSLAWQLILYDHSSHG